MDNVQSDKVLESMIQFIDNHGKEQAKEIAMKTEQEYTIGRFCFDIQRLKRSLDKRKRD